MLRNYFTIAWRSLSKQKIGTVVNIAGLSMGIAACLLIYVISASELSFDQFHPDKERIYRVVSDVDNPSGGKFYVSQVPYPAALAFRDQFTGVEGTTYFISYGAKVTISDKQAGVKRWGASDPSEIIMTDASYFSIFPCEWLAGNPSTALSRPFKVVLTESKARIYFGSIPVSEMMGREVIYDDSLRLTVSGIVKDWNRNSDLIFRDFISFSTIQSSFLKNMQNIGPSSRADVWTWSDNAQVFVKLAKENKPSQFREQAERMFKDQLIISGGRKATMYLQPLSSIHFDANFQDFYSSKASLPALYGLMGIAAFILLLAVSNFINLSTAQSLHRAKEIGIRKVLGSSRRNLILQFLAETFILTSLAVILSLLIVRTIFADLPTFFPNRTIFYLGKPYTVIFLISITVLTSILAGFYPASVLSSWQPAVSLKGYTKTGAGHKNYLRKGLIVFQFSISLFFIIGTLITGSQLRYLLGKDPGFVRDAIIMIGTSGNYATDKPNILAERIRSLSGVSMASTSIEAPMINRLRGGNLLCRDRGTKVIASERVGDEFYVPLFGLKLLAGRNFSPPHDDTTGFIPSQIPYGYNPPDKHVEFLINETCSRQLGFKKPEEALGHFVESGTIKGPVVGVMADFHAQSLFSPIGPVFLFGSKNLLWTQVNVKLSSGSRDPVRLKAILSDIGKCWKEVYPNEPFAYSFLDKTIAGFYEKERQTTRVINTATFIAILISCMGLFGLIRFTAEQRVREIGIRKVLGAGGVRIVTMLTKEFVMLILIAAIVASPIAYYFEHNWLQNFAYRINIQWTEFVIAVSLAILVALVTIGYQAIKAATANPVKSLRTE